MFRYLIIESMTPIASIASTLMSVFNDVLRIDEVETAEKQMIIFYQGELDFSFQDIIINLSSDTLTDFRLFESYRFHTIKERDKNLTYIMNMLAEIAITKRVYLNEQMVLSLLIRNINPSYRACFLKAYANDQRMLNTVRVYLESNQNMSYAAKQLFIHRNTLIQRIDKFIDHTGFDVRQFIPGCLIYQLINFNY